MARTDKQRPFDVQRYVETSGTYEDHDHRNGFCRMGTLQDWKQRYSGRNRYVAGMSPRTLHFPCDRVFEEQLFNKAFTPNPQHRANRRRESRRNRHQARRLAKWAAYDQTRRLGTSVLADDHEVYSQLAEQSPRKFRPRTGRAHYRPKPYQPKPQPRVVKEVEPHWLQRPWWEWPTTGKSIHGRKSKSL